MAGKGHVVGQMVGRGHPLATGRQTTQAAGNTGSAWQRGRAITSSTILLGTVCLKRKSEKGPKSRFRQTPSGSTSTNKYEPLPTNWFVWNANPKKVRNRVSDKLRPCLSETFCVSDKPWFVWNANCLKRCPTSKNESLDLENKRKTLRSHQFWFPTAQRCGKLLFPTKIVSSAFCLFCFVDRRAPFPELPFIHFYYIWRSQLFFVQVTKSPGSKFLLGAHNTPSSLTS